MWFISFYLTDQSGSGITLDSVIKILTKRRSLYIFDWLTVNTELTSISNSLVVQSEATKQNASYRHNNESSCSPRRLREEVFETYIHITFISLSITIIGEEAILAGSAPFSIAHNTPVSQRRRGQFRTSRAVYSASYC